MSKKLHVVLFCTVAVAAVLAWGLTARAQSVPSAEEMTLHVIPQAHIDMAWWWRYDPETIRVIVPKTLQMAFSNLETFPDYTFSFLQVPGMAPLEELDPELFYKIHYYIYHAEPMGLSIPNPHGESQDMGRFKIVHGLYVESDGCCPGGEAVVRQCLYGKRWFKNKFGIDVKSAWFLDAWTHPWTYPQILKKSGIDSYMFNRGWGGNNDERMFWWEAPDGSRVFAYKPATFTGNPEPAMWRKETDDVRKRYGVKDYMAVVGVGDHGGGLLGSDIGTMRKAMAEMPGRAVFSTPQKFLQAVLSDKHDFPVVRTEIGPTIRGSYTTIGEIKKGNRESEDLLMTAEKFGALAAWLGGSPYPQADLNDAWKKVLLNQFHDMISGTCVPDATDDALERYREVLATGRDHLMESLRRIASLVNTQGEGVPVLVFNPLSWQRTDAAQAELEIPGANASIRMIDSSGAPVATQVVGHEERHGKHYVKVLFLAEGVPSLGYKTYRVVSGEGASSAANSLEISESRIENEFYRIELDPTTGCLKSVVDKRTGKEVLDRTGQGNLLQVIDDFGDSEGFLRTADGAIDDRHKWTEKTVNADRSPEIQVLERGPVRAVLQIKQKWEFARFTQKVMLYPKVARIDFEMAVDWQGKNKMVKLAFPTSIGATEATYEIPYGTIRRPSMGEEQNAQKWVDVSDASYGVALLNDSRYGYDVKNNVIRLSVLRSPSGPAWATDERGTQTLKYALYPHQGGWREAGVTERGHELNYPLITLADSQHSGNLPLAHSFLAIEPGNVIAEVVKKAEDSSNFILRIYETEGKSTTAKVTLAQPVDAVHQVDLMENPLKEIKTDGKSFQVPLGAYSIESFKLVKD
jgi:alpha-mannosidase